MSNTAQPEPTRRADRVALLCAAVSQGWVTILLGRSVEPAAGGGDALGALSLWPALLLAAISIGSLALAGLFGREAVRSRRGLHGPAARVRLSRVAMLLIGTVLIGLGVASAALFGTLSMVVAAIAAVGIGFHVVVGRFFPPVGVITLALLMALVMALPNPRLTFLFPLMLAVLHATIAGAAHHRFTARRPRLRPLDWAALGAGWVFWTLGLAVLMNKRVSTTEGGAMAHAPELLRWVWAGPTISFTLFIVALALTVRCSRNHRVLSRNILLVASLGMIGHNTAWLLGIGRIDHAALLAALGVVPLLVLMAGEAGSGRFVAK